MWGLPPPSSPPILQSAFRDCFVLWCWPYIIIICVPKRIWNTRKKSFTSNYKKTPFCRGNEKRFRKRWEIFGEEFFSVLRRRGKIWIILFWAKKNGIFFRQHLRIISSKLSPWPQHCNRRCKPQTCCTCISPACSLALILAICSSKVCFFNLHLCTLTQQSF